MTELGHDSSEVGRVLLLRPVKGCPTSPRLYGAFLPGVTLPPWLYLRSPLPTSLIAFWDIFLSTGSCLFCTAQRLPWNKSHTVGRKVNETNTGNGSITDNDQSVVQPTSPRAVLLPTTATNPVSHAAPTPASAQESVTRRTETNAWPNSTRPRSTDGIALSSHVTMVSKDGITNSATNFNRIPVSVVTLTTWSDFSGVTKSAAAISTSTARPSNSTVTYSTVVAVSHPSDTSSSNPSVLFPTGITPTSPTAKHTKQSPTPNFNSTQQTTELNHNFTGPSTAPSEPKDISE
ncbi:PREDICTED: mucin-3B-like, partial [Eurypyga helias]|uniref:mucin-3B-like n=1 Tax=Eurypyga helias TaxID=54383 RepID=UPI00052879E1